MRRLMKKGSSGQGLVLLGCATTPYLLGYRWSADGFGTQFLATALAAAPLVVQLSPSGAAVVATHQTTSPYLSAVPVSFVGGFGTKLADPATLPASGAYGLAFTPDGEQILVGDSGTPYLSGYEWAGAFGLKYANPGTLPAGTVRSMSVHPDGNAILTLDGASTPYVRAWKWSDIGFGTKYTDPAGTAPTSGLNYNSAKFSRSGGGVAVAAGGTPFVHGWPWAYASGFGTKYSNPATLPAGAANCIAFNAAGTVVAVGHATSPFMSFYAWTDATGWGAKFADPSSLPTDAVLGIKFLPGDRGVVCTMAASPYVEAWAWDNATGFGAKYANPGTLPPGGCRGVDFLAV